MSYEQIVQRQRTRNKLRQPAKLPNLLFVPEWANIAQYSILPNTHVKKKNVQEGKGTMVKIATTLYTVKEAPLSAAVRLSIIVAALGALLKRTNNIMSQKSPSL